MEFIGQITVIVAILAAAAYMLYISFGKKKSGSANTKWLFDDDEYDNSDNTPSSGSSSHGTRLFEKLFIEQLTNDGKIMQTSTVYQLPVVICRDNSKNISDKFDGDCIYLKKCRNAETVSNPHIGIDEDENGMFFSDLNSTNKTYLVKGRSRKPIKGADIKDSMIVSLGDQLIRFRLPENVSFEFDEFDDEFDEDIPGDSGEYTPGRHSPNKKKNKININRNF